MDISMRDEIQPMPAPDDFINYLPWACRRYALKMDAFVVKKYESSVTQHPSTGRTKTGRSRSRSSTNRTKESDQSVIPFSPHAITVIAIYDTSENLVQLDFSRNDFILKEMLRVLSFFIKFYPSLHTIVVGKVQIDGYIIPEISRILSHSDITELCFDGAFNPSANYHLVLDNQTHLQYLSLARCRITDEDIENIADKLKCSSPASKTLTALNLSSNAITDIGAKHLEIMLRTNRTLCYLNLSDNHLTDVGASYILESLTEFHLEYDEIIDKKITRLEYLKELSKMIEIMKEEESETEKPRNVATPKDKKSKKPTHITTKADEKFVQNENSLDTFNHPFNAKNIVVKSEFPFCLGNNVLCYLNLAYNNLTYGTLMKLIEILTYQRNLARMPRGLMRVVLNGNDIPYQCSEFKEFEEMLSSAVITSCGSKRSIISTVKRRSTKTVQPHSKPN